MKAKIIDFFEELVANALSQEDEFKYDYYTKIYFELSCIKDDKSYKKELMKFEYPTSEEIKSFFSKLSEFDLKCEYIDNKLIYSNKEVTIIINSIYYSYDIFDLRITYSIRSNLLNHIKINYDCMLADLLIDYKALRNPI